MLKNHARVPRLAWAHLRFQLASGAVSKLSCRERPEQILEALDFQPLTPVEPFVFPARGVLLVLPSPAVLQVAVP